MRFLPVTLLGMAVSAPALASVTFDEVVIDAGFHVDQPVLVASLADGERHVVLAGRDDEHAQRMAIVAVGAQPKTIRSLAPGARLIAYDIGRFAGRDALLFIEPGRIMRLDMSSGDFSEFVAIRSIYGQRRSGHIVPVDFIRDINSDGLDDVVVPDTAGYRIRLQREDGSLGPEVVLEGSSTMSVSDGRVSFESRPLVTGNLTGDGLPDLAVWRGDELFIYARRNDDTFEGTPRKLKLDLGLRSEAELLDRVEGFGAVNQEGRIDTRIWQIEDFNGDGVPDILTESLLNEGVFDKENDFRLHLGRRDGNDVSYSSVADALLASSGLQYGLVTTDLDGDGRKDIAVRRVRMSFGRVIRALLAGSVPLQLHFYRMTAEDSYPPEANYVTRTNVSFSMSSGQVDIPAIGVADFDGDGLEDLLLQTDADEAELHPGVPGAELFSAATTRLTFDLPRNGELVSAEDLNDDGRADLILRYDESDGDGRSRTVRLLFAAP